MDDTTYTDYFDADEVASFKFVKRGTMQLARIARGVVAEMVGGTVQEGDGRKEYVSTSRGLYRMAMAHNSDNRVELREHDRLGAEVVSMGDSADLAYFFACHGLPGRESVSEMRRSVREKLRA